MADYTIEQTAGQCCVVLAGDFTASIVPELQAALKTALSPDVTDVVFDLSHTVMLDSSGIGLLIATFNTLARRQGRMRVIQVSPEILQLLQSMRLVNRLNVDGRKTEEVARG